MIFIAAAGNNGPKGAPVYPAAYPEVIAVTATDEKDDGKLDWSGGIPWGRKT